MAYNPPYLYSLPLHVQIHEVAEDGGRKQPETAESQDPSSQTEPYIHPRYHRGHPRFSYSWPCPLCNKMNVEEELAIRDTQCRCRFCHRSFMNRETWLEHYEGCLRHVSIKINRNTNKLDILPHLLPTTAGSKERIGVI